MLHNTEKRGVIGNCYGVQLLVFVLSSYWEWIFAHIVKWIKLKKNSENKLKSKVLYFSLLRGPVSYALCHGSKRVFQYTKWIVIKNAVIIMC